MLFVIIYISTNSQTTFQIHRFHKQKSFFFPNDYHNNDDDDDDDDDKYESVLNILKQ